MFYNFDFNKDKKFFTQSKTHQYIIDFVKKELPHITEKTQTACVKLFTESIIKHNLSANMLKSEFVYFIDEKNSSDVTSVLGKIMLKNKDKRTRDDFELLQQHSLVQNIICLYVYRNIDGNDICENLKNEFIDFKNILNNTNTEKNSKTIKPSK